MRILWTHNFDPAIANHGTFMHAFADGMRRQGTEIELLYLGRLTSPRALREARQRVADVSPSFDIVHAQTGGAVGLASSAARSRAKVVSLRGSEWYRYREHWNREAVHALVSVAMTKAALRAYDEVVVMSARMQREVRSWRSSLFVHCIPDPIDIGLFRPMDRMQARAALGRPDDTGKWVLFTTLSRSNPIKRVGLAEAAVAVANGIRGDVRLEVATGLQHHEMPVFVSACDIALSTSVHEGWPNAIKEALACNVPFVATDVSDLATIARMEPSCRVCPPDPVALGRALCEVLAMPPGPLRRHVEPMAPDIAAASLLEVYEAVLRRKSGEAGR